ncbi:MAG: MFS transporter [Nitrospirae bacterium]|nr:MFS transporter [Nitrospirota bacterium]
MFRRMRLETSIAKFNHFLVQNRANHRLWGAAIGHASVHWFHSTFYLLLPLIKKELGLSYTEMGLLVTIRFVAGALITFPSGMATDLLGRRSLIMAIAFGCVSIPYLLLGVSYSYVPLLICMSFVGVGNNLWHPAALSTISDAYPGRRGWAIGWHESAANAGDAIGPLMSGILLTWMVWRHILLGSFIPSLCIGMSIVWLLGRRNFPEAKVMQTKQIERISVARYFEGLGKLLLNPSIVILALISGVRSMTQNGLSTFLPSFFINFTNLSPLISGVYLTIIQVSGLIAAPLSGRLSDQYGQKRVVTPSLLLTGLAIFLLVFVNVPSLFVVFLGVIGFFLYSLRPVLFSWAMELAPREMGGSVVGIQFSFQSILAALAPVVGGWIADKWGLSHTFYFLAAMLLFSNLLVVFVREAAHERP